MHAVRRRTLAGLVALAVLALIGALAWRSWMWAPQLLLDAAVVGYLMVIKAAADRERRAAARRHARAAHRARLEQEQARRRPAPRPVVPAARPEPVVVHETGPIHPSLPLAPVHPLRPGRVVAARGPVSAGWQQSAVVGLDDEDIGFAEIDVYAPARGGQRLNQPLPAPRTPWRRRRERTVSSPSEGLWRSPVAHLVRIEGVRGSIPLSSTLVRPGPSGPA